MRKSSWAKFGLVCAITLALSPMTRGGLSAQSSDPSNLPLLSSADLQYLGGFRLPTETANGANFSYGGRAMAFDPATNSLYITGERGTVGEVSIPVPVVSSVANDLPYARLLQPFADPAEGHIAADLTTGGAGLSGLMVYGNRLYGTATIWYDAQNTQRVSHFSRSLQLNQPSFSGWSPVWRADRSGYVSGWMAPVPSEWQRKLGGPALTGQCCVSIVSRTSNGPAAFAFDPAGVGTSLVSATPVLYYTILPGQDTLGPWGGSNPTYGATAYISGMAVIAGTRTALYFGRNGSGEYCYGNGTTDQSLVGTVGDDGARYCYDTDAAKGQHAFPYRYQVWAYDLDDLAAVKAGTKQPWDVVPYGVWPLNLPTPAPNVWLGGVAYDAVRQIVYVTQLNADNNNGVIAAAPIIHAFRLSATPGANNPTNTASAVTLTTDRLAPQLAGTPITFSAQPTGGVAPYQYKWIVSDSSTVTVAANWNASNRFTWTPTAANATYRISVWVRSAGNTADALEGSASLAFPVSSPTGAIATSVALTANRVAPQAPFTAVTWTARPANGVAPHQYKWFVSDGSSSTLVSDWSTTNSYVWTPSTANANYRFTVWVRSAGNTADAQEASTTSTPFPIETAVTSSVTTPVSSVAISANKTAPQPAGTPINWNAVATGGTAPLLYKWSVFDGSNWIVVTDWSSSPTYTWTPGVANPGFRVGVWAKRASNPADALEAATFTPFAIEASATAVVSAPVSSVAISANKAAPQAPGAAITWNAVATGGTAPLLYKWSVFDGSNWIVVANWSASATYTWTPTAANPGYRVAVWVKGASNPADALEASTSTAFPIQTAVVAPSVPTVPTAGLSVAITADKAAPQRVGAALTFTAVATGGTSPLLYKWSIFNGSEWIVVTGWSASPTYTWTPTAANPAYRVGVWVKRASNPADALETANFLAFPISN